MVMYVIILQVGIISSDAIWTWQLHFQIEYIITEQCIYIIDTDSFLM